MAFPAHHQRRWLEELRELRLRHPTIHRIELVPFPVVEGTIQTAVGPRGYRLVFPHDFPVRPPSIWELGGDPPQAVVQREYGHAFADGSVCLFGHSAEDGWQMHYRAAFALDRFREYIVKVACGDFPRVERIPREIPAFRVSVHPRIIEALRAGADWGPLRGFMRADGRFMLITEAFGTNSSKLIISGHVHQSPPERWLTTMALAPKWEGIWCRIDEERDGFLPDQARFGTWIEQHIASADARAQLAATRVILIVQRKTSWLVRFPDPSVLPAVPQQSRIPIEYARVLEEDIPQRLFLRVDDRIQATEKLRQCHVAIVGVGSLGSSIALALAKAGIGRFRLLDPEVLEPENVVRHVGGVHEIGLPKVAVVARAILRVNPDAEIVPVDRPLSLDPEGWGLETLAHVQQVARDPKGLLVCTTATVEAERIVNALSITEKRPAVFASVLGHAEHGRVFRVLPGKTPCYQCILHAQVNESARFPRFEGQETGTPAYRQPGIPGLGMDIDQVALIAARLALQTLGEMIEGGIGYPRAHADHFIWSTHGNWHAVDGPLQSRVEQVPRNPECPVCGVRVTESLTLEEEAELRALSGASGDTSAGS